MGTYKGLMDLSDEEEYTRNMLDDLQLAAELGKTLLERNKELESALRQHQNIIDDQTQEIEYLTKQTVALREVNDSRLRIYEQLEVSIQDLERANHRLVLENSAEKKHIKSLTATIEGLENKCEELQTTIDDLRLQVDVLKRRAQRTSPDAQKQIQSPSQTTLSHVSFDYSSNPASPDSTAIHTEEVQCKANTPSKKTDRAQAKTRTPYKIEKEDSDMEADSSMEQISQLLTQLRESRSQCGRDERRITELEEQLSTMVQQNQALENQVIQLTRDEESKSMKYELTHLEEVRQGQMCSRCLRSVDQNSSDLLEDDDSSILDALNNTTSSQQNQHRSSFYMDVQDYRESQNPYKQLVEKYEALLKVHCPQNVSMSLQEEMQMSGDFNTVSTKDTDEESGRGDSLKPEKQHKKTRKIISQTPTDFSEAETSSSGFSDETYCNKFTQTEGRAGSFLCTIADGEDCKFSIYDDASTIDSRFRNKPEYQKLFKEIFSVLKKAAESKEEGEDLPLLDDHAAILQSTPKVPPVTPSADQLPEFPDDDSQSVLSSTMSELSVSHNEPTTVIENIIQSQNEPIPEPDSVPNQSANKDERILKPLVRQPLDLISVEARKRNSSRRRNKFSDRSDSPVTHIIGSPKINYSNRPNSGRKRREYKNNAADSENSAWNGSSMQFWSNTRNTASPTPSQGSGKGYIEFKPSTASQDLHKLKKLDLSYAEVLRNADNKKRQLAKQRRK